MANKNQIKNPVLSIVIVAIFIWIIYFVVTQKRGAEMILENYDYELNRSYNGIITKKFYDHENHNSPKIVFADGDSTGINGKFWGQMEEGDSISKVKGDSVIQVFRGGKRINIEIAPFYRTAIQNEIEKKKK